MRLNTHQALYVRSMGKEFRVTAIFHNVKESNRYMEKHPDEAVIAYVPPYVILANKYREEE